MVECLIWFDFVVDLVWSLLNLFCFSSIGLHLFLLHCSLIAGYMASAGGGNFGLILEVSVWFGLNIFYFRFIGF